ncbi:MAG: hypothetical protein JWN89_123 [Parcubacteria group bacterium]|nr:hypothetical protein [Parcubacteria group bacterium]
MKTTKNTMTHTLEKGSASTAGIALGILVLFVILGGALYRSDYPGGSQPANIISGLPQYSTNEPAAEPSVVYTTVEVPTGETRQVYQPATTKVVNRAVSPFPGGSTYHNSAYGLTVPLPAGWSNVPSVGADVYAGIPDTASIHFAGPGGQTLTVNVFTKEQWNNIRIQETLGQTNSFGEGNYLGENFTYIYSVQGSASDLQNISNRILFY